jgi:hypothetical protein
MQTTFITPDMTRIFCVTLLDSSRFYFMEEKNIELFFGGAVWAWQSTLTTDYVINGVFLNPAQIDALSNQSKIYEHRNFSLESSLNA